MDMDQKLQEQLHRIEMLCYQILEKLEAEPSDEEKAQRWAEIDAKVEALANINPNGIN